MNVSREREPAGRASDATNRHSSLHFGLGFQVLSLFYWVISLSAALPLMVYAYLGIFTRYGADDYCATSQLLGADSFWQASVTRYLGWSGGYSNLLFIQIGEWFGNLGMILMAPVALLLWVIGLTWLIMEIGEASGLRWKIGLSFVLAALAIFFSLYQTPRLHQVLYWRSSLVGYLAALVLLCYLAAFILHQLRRPLTRAGRLGSSLIVFTVVFVIAGTSETIDALQIGILLICLLVLYFWKRNVRRDAFLLLGISLASAVLSMIIMAFSPGNSIRMGVSSMPMPDLFSLGAESLTYVFQFILNSLKVSPLPATLSFFIPLLLFSGLCSPISGFSQEFAQKLKWVLLFLPLAMLFVMTFSFAPHAYARSFPSAYVRFPALFLLTLTLLAEGSLLGLLLSQADLPLLTLRRSMMLGFVLLTFLYPVRAAVNLYGQAPEYRAHAIVWDARDRHIRQAVAAGEKDLVVPQIDTIGGVQEYKGNEFFWVNRCAAEYYGLDSLRAP